MKRVWQRFVSDVRHLFDRTSINPFIDSDNEEPGLLKKERTGAEDVTHAFKNLFVEAARRLKRRIKDELEQG